ncbi:MAG: gamma carbonic anhydrase family protein [Pseudomonadales bacterium]
MGDYWVAPNATLIGSVIVGNNVSVWFNAVVRADHQPITIGENTNIQDGCVLHVEGHIPLTIGRNVTVGHKVMLHGCEIGDNSLIGINAVVLNDAKVGKNCLIAANALVPEGKEIPDGSLVMGSPGKVVRQLTDEQIEGLALSAQGYVENFKKFRDGLEEMK